MVLTEIHSVWQYGCVISLEGDWALLQEFSCSHCICAAFRSSNPCAPLVEFLSNIIEQILVNVYPKHDRQIKLSCTHCIQLGASDPYTFTKRDCDLGLLAAKGTLDCQRNNIATPVKITEIAPDLSLTQLNDIKIELSDINLEKQKLAAGAFGVVYRGIYKSNRVAVKLLNTEGKSPDEQIAIFEEFRREVTLLKSMKHPNIVSLEGYCYGSGDIGMVMEYVSCGDLQELIKDKSIHITKGLYLKLAFEIAHGLNYLHSLTPPIIHRDLKPPNVLLGSSKDKWKYTAKLADFGLSTRQYLCSLKEDAVETPLWVAPEILSGGKYSTKSDVYSFGLVFYQLVERKQIPYDFGSAFLNQLENDVISGKRSDISHLEETDPNIAQIIKNCWHPNPMERPSFDEVMKLIVLNSQVNEPALYNHLYPRYKELRSASSSPKLTSEENNQPIVALTGKFLKKVETGGSAVSCMIVVGNEIWIAHKNGDISIWNAKNGTIFREIIAAHSQEILTMILVGNRVWSGSTDGVIKIWKSQCSVEHNKTNVIRKEGYLEPAGK